jgi:hypothetical protein
VVNRFLSALGDDERLEVAAQSAIARHQHGAAEPGD